MIYYIRILGSNEKIIITHIYIYIHIIYIYTQCSIHQNVYILCKLLYFNTCSHVQSPTSACGVESSVPGSSGSLSVTRQPRLRQVGILVQRPLELP